MWQNRCNGIGKNGEKLAHMETAQMIKLYSQLWTVDFVFPNRRLNPKNGWVKLAVLVDWDVAQLVNNGHPAYPVRMALVALLIQ